MPIDQSGPTTRRRLGRGLGSLISGPVEVHPPAAPPPHAPSAPAHPGAAVELSRQPGESDGGIRLIGISSIRPNPRQPRQDFNEASLLALADSIRQAGLMQPVIVRPGAGPEYELVAGERRWRAARLVGLEAIPAIVRELDDRQAAQWALIENLQREDLNPIERAEAFRRLVDEHGMSHQAVAEAVGLDRSTVTNLLRLLELDADIQQALRRGELTLGHAKALLAFDNLEARRTAARQAVRQRWSVRELERRAAAARRGSRDASGRSASSAAPAHLRDLERRLGEHLGTRVRIQPGARKGTGRLVIEYYSLDQFDGLLERMGLAASL